MNGLCLRCVSYNKDVVKNCPTLNSFIVFLHNHKIQATIVSCRAFKDKEAVEEVKVISGHEFENDVMKLAQAEEQILTQTEAEAEEEMTKQAQEAEVQQELKEKGGNDADHRIE
jgi:hypothetical protein